LVMDLEETEARSDCAGEGQQQFSSQAVVSQLVVISKKAVAACGWP
jgi:hypothetical protein